MKKGEWRASLQTYVVGQNRWEIYTESELVELWWMAKWTKMKRKYNFHIFSGLEKRATKHEEKSNIVKIWKIHIHQCPNCKMWQKASSSEAFLVALWCEGCWINGKSTCKQLGNEGNMATFFQEFWSKNMAMDEKIVLQPTESITDGDVACWRIVI